MKVYFDNAATTAMRPEVIASMVKVMNTTFANPSATYANGRSAKAILETSRKKIAKQLGVLDSEIVFTSGGTESNNLVLQGAVSKLGVKHIITSKIEHHAVLKTCQYLAEYNDVIIHFVPVLSTGEIDYNALEEILKSLVNDSVLVSLMHINNETGVVLDLPRIGDLCETYDALFHSDTVQTIGHYNIDFKEVKMHFATASAHKFYGPKGVGFAYVCQSCKLNPLQHGGEQERGVRAGTEAIHQIKGMEVAFKMAYAELKEETAYVLSLKKHLLNKFEKDLPQIAFNGFSNDLSRNYNLLNILLPISSEKANTILFELDLSGIAVSRGSACQSGSNKPSHVLAEFLEDSAIKKTSLRLSFSIYNTLEEVDYFIDILKKIVTKYV